MSIALLIEDLSEALRGSVICEENLSLLNDVIEALRSGNLASVNTAKHDDILSAISDEYCYSYELRARHIALRTAILSARS